MKSRLLLVLAGVFVAGCAQPHPEPGASAETVVRRQLETFLTFAVDEFVHELGSWTAPWGAEDARWEEPYVTRDLLWLGRMETARLDAFDQGLRYDHTNPDILKSPSPRSFWLPISPEGDYTFEINSIVVSEQKASASVRFTMEYAGQTYPDDEEVRYEFEREDGAWKISDVISGDDTLRDYLLRDQVM